MKEMRLRYTNGNRSLTGQVEMFGLSGTRAGFVMIAVMLEYRFLTGTEGAGLSAFLPEAAAAGEGICGFITGPAVIFTGAHGLLMTGVFMVLTEIAVHDRESGRIPDSLNLAVFILAVSDNLLLGMPLIERGCSCLGAGLILLIISLASGTGIGGGDIKLVAAAAFLCGARKIAAACLIGLFPAGIYGIMLMILHKASKDDRFPLGPFLCFGIGWVIGS